MGIIQTTVIEQELRSEARRPVTPPARRAIACAVLHNPLAGQPPRDDHAELVDLSFEVGTLLTELALRRLDAAPRAYGKAAIVGMDGDLEHGAAMIHVRVGLAMRRGIGAGLALIPGNAKVGGPGTQIDLTFGGIGDGWDYDAMDTVPVVIPGAPKPDEIVLCVGFATGRPGARTVGASAADVAALVRGFST
ncbi:MAG TPA: amino acid synthesis family protein [Paracoccaceae bacterium]|nr:amino acid synthesis family protein [Paracoccaceae bacterium]